MRQLLGQLAAGDVLLADVIFSNYWTIALLLRQGVDMISHHDGRRHVDFRQGQRLGRYDHVVPWHKPVRPFWMSRKLYRALPETLTVREVKVEVTQKGFRRRHLLLITTLLDPKVYPQEDLATAFRCRWHAELDLRSIKHVMQTMPTGRQVDVLRCKSPAMVRKEVWMHLLAQAAAKVGICPRDISFKGTLQTLVAFAAAGWSCPDRRNELYTTVLKAVATHRVNDRPDRVEPRAVKRRPKKQVYLNEPRSIVTARLLKGV